MKTTRTKKASGLKNHKSENDTLSTKNKGISAPYEFSPADRVRQSEALVVYTDRSITGNNSFLKIS